MRAIVFDRFGDESVLRLGEAPTPPLVEGAIRKRPERDGSDHGVGSAVNMPHAALLRHGGLYARLHELGAGALR